MEFLTLFIITYNVGMMEPSRDTIGSFVWPKTLKEHGKPDLYVIGLQEPPAIVNGKESFKGVTWLSRIKKILLVRGYAPVTEVRLKGVILSVYCLYDKLPLITAESIKTGIVKHSKIGYKGNRGAVYASLNINEKSYCLINTYMPYHSADETMETRKQNISDIKKQIMNDISVDSHNYVFWFGEMNFMINPDVHATLEDVITWENERNYNQILFYDELGYSMATNADFKRFKEQYIDFPPTYQYVVNSQNYKKPERSDEIVAPFPSYTDRILFKTNDDKTPIEGVMYNSNVDFSASEHRPVFALFKIPGPLKMPLISFKNIDDYELYDNPTVYLSIIQKGIWDTKNDRLLIYEIHDFVLYIFGIDKIQIIGNSLEITVKKHELTELKRGGYVVYYVRGNNILSVSRIFKM